MVKLYIFLLCVAILPALFFRVDSSKRKKRYLILVFSITGLTSAFRCVSVGTDTMQFCAAYTAIGETSWRYVFTAFRYEKGFILLCKLLNCVSTDYQLLIIVTSCFITFSFALFIYRNSDDVVIGTVIFLCMNYYETMNLMRQYIVIAILLYGIEFIKKKKYMVFFLLLSMAMLFHSSAFICILYFLCYKISFSKRTFPISPLITIALAVGYRALLNIVFLLPFFSRYSTYVESRYDVDSSAGRVLKIVISAGVLLIIILFRNRDSGENKERFNFDANMISVWLIMQILMNRMAIFVRMVIYFKFVSITALSNAAASIRKKDMKIFMRVALIVLMTVYLFGISMNLTESKKAEYELFLSNNKYEYALKIWLQSLK